jgi:hypothetical protein
MCADNHIFLKNGSQIFFAKGVTNRISLNRLTKSICPRGQFCAALRRRARSIRQNRATDLPVEVNQLAGVTDQTPSSAASVVQARAIFRRAPARLTE